jgi:DNA-directed RNA polymerase specialized sigma24 family protein
MEYPEQRFPYGTFGRPRNHRTFDHGKYLKIRSVLLQRLAPLPCVPIEDVPEYLLAGPTENTVEDVDVGWLLSKHLNSRHKRVIFMRYWEEKTYQQCGDFMGVCASRIQQMERKALLKLRKALGVK